MRTESKQEQIAGKILFVGGLLFIAVSLYLCFSRDIWYDEIFTLGLGRSSYGELISIASRDVHPPLYYLLLKAGLDVFALLFAGGDGIVAVKLFSVLPFCLILVYCIVFVRKRFGMLTAGLAAFLICSMPQLSSYMTEMRMYGYAMFFLMAGMLHAFEAIHSETEGRRHFIPVTLYVLAAAYTHYFAAAGGAMIYGYLFFELIRKARHGNKNRWEVLKPLLISGVCCMILYLPWCSALLLQVGQVNENYWILPLTIRNLGGCVKFLFKPAFQNELVNLAVAVILCLIYAGMLGYSLLLLKRKEGQKEILFSYGLLSVLIFVVLFGFTASFLIRPVFIYRYMIPAAGAFWLCFSILLVKTNGNKHVLYGIILLCAIVGIRNYRAFYGEEMWKRVHMEETEAMFRNIQEEDILIFNFLHTQGVVSVCLPNETYLMWYEPEELVKEMYPNVHGFPGEEAGSETLQIREWLSQGRTVWFFGSGNVREEIRAEWEKEGIRTEEQGSYLLERYWFNLYTVSLE